MKFKEYVNQLNEFLIDNPDYEDAFVVSQHPEDHHACLEVEEGRPTLGMYRDFGSNFEFIWKWDTGDVARFKGKCVFIG